MKALEVTVELQAEGHRIREMVENTKRTLLALRKRVGFGD